MGHNYICIYLFYSHKWVAFFWAFSKRTHHRPTVFFIKQVPFCKLMDPQIIAKNSHIHIGHSSIYCKSSSLVTTHIDFCFSTPKHNIPYFNNTISIILWKKKNHKNVVPICMSYLCIINTMMFVIKTGTGGHWTTTLYNALAE